MTAPALANRCEVCKAKPGEKCSNTIKPGEPLPGRAHHHARTPVVEKETGGNDASY